MSSSIIPCTLKQRHSCSCPRCINQDFDLFSQQEEAVASSRSLSDISSGNSAESFVHFIVADNIVDNSSCTDSDRDDAIAKPSTVLRRDDGHVGDDHEQQEIDFDSIDGGIFNPHRHFTAFPYLMHRGATMRQRFAALYEAARKDDDEDEEEENVVDDHGIDAHDDYADGLVLANLPWRHIHRLYWGDAVVKVRKGWMRAADILRPFDHLVRADRRCKDSRADCALLHQIRSSLRAAKAEKLFGPQRVARRVDRVSMAVSNAHEFNVARHQMKQTHEVRSLQHQSRYFSDDDDENGECGATEEWMKQFVFAKKN